ncbi:TfoX/Sxy family DNA transformation protein [Testudinibacter sp. P27/CKL/0425]
MSNMQSYVHSTKEKLNRLIGDVVVRSLFSGYGFYRDNHMFGIVQNGIFYLRAEGDLARLIERHGAFPCPYSKNNHAPSLKRYYGLHTNITDNDALYHSVVLQSISQIKQQKLDFELSKKTRIKELCNLGVKHERLLIKININDVNQLRQVGAEMAYIRMKKLGFSVTLDFYWNLVGALQNLPVALLSSEYKKHCLKKLNLYLQREGMRAEKG